MVDYCMCSGDGCSVKNKCARYRFKPCEYHQSYFVGTPGKGKDCSHFIDAQGWESMLLPEDEIDNRDMIEMHKEYLENENKQKW